MLNQSGIFIYTLFQNIHYTTSSAKIVGIRILLPLIAPPVSSALATPYDHEPSADVTYTFEPNGTTLGSTATIPYPSGLPIAETV